MSDYLPKEPKDPGKPSPTRIALWVFVALVGVYFVVSGIVGGITGG
ncbi:hypothetical protein BH09ACT3_BH09ACT3_04940 [soil metagenome]